MHSEGDTQAGKEDFKARGMIEKQRRTGQRTTKGKWVLVSAAAEGDKE